MSMLSAQIESLRYMSKRLDHLYALITEQKDHDPDDAFVLNPMRDASVALRDAADAIEQLREMAQEVAPLRERLREDFGALAKQNAELNRENARLRDLVRHLYACTEHSGCVMCPYVDEPCDFKYEMRECGMEVE